MKASPTDGQTDRHGDAKKHLKMIFSLDEFFGYLVPWSIGRFVDWYVILLQTRPSGERRREMSWQNHMSTCWRHRRMGRAFHFIVQSEAKRKEKRRAGASNGQRYPLPCCTYFGNLKCVQQGKGYCWSLLAPAHLFSILKLKQGSRPKGDDVL